MSFQLFLFFLCVSDEDSVLMMWSSFLPQEVKDLNVHSELREQITAKMREQAHDHTSSLYSHYCQTQYQYEIPPKTLSTPF